MWTCDRCHERMDEPFDSCWKCQAPRTSGAPPTLPSISPRAPEKMGSWEGPPEPRPQPERFRTYRPGATLWPFLFWTLLAMSGAYFAESRALHLPRRNPDRWIYTLIAGACVVMGPLAFTAHFLRSRHTCVTVSKEEGLILSRGRRIPWAAIRSVDYRSSPFLGGRPIEKGFGIPKGLFRAHWSRASFTLEVAILVLLLIIYFVFLPVLFLLSPWHPRVIVHLTDGDRVVFRDLEDDHDFVSLVRMVRWESRADRKDGPASE